MTTTIRVRCPKCSAQFDTSTRSDQALCQICGTLSERAACELAQAQTRGAGYGIDPGEWVLAEPQRFPHVRSGGVGVLICDNCGTMQIDDLRTSNEEYARICEAFGAKHNYCQET